MSVLVAALDDSAATRPVIDVTRRLAAFVDADVEAVHVREDDSGSTAAAVAEAAGVPLHLRDGDVVDELVAAASPDEVLAVVVGARRMPSGAVPCGHVALELLPRLQKAVVVVPPETVDRPLRRVLIAIEGDGESEALGTLADGLGDRPGPEVVALHVFEPHALPLFGDSPVLETEAWAREFLHRSAGAPFARVRLEVRVGNAVDVVQQAARDLDADLVVMGWHRDLGPGRARIVRAVLTTSPVPVLLLPTGAAIAVA